MSLRSAVIVLALALLINVAGCAIVGYLAPLNLSQPLTRTQAAQALDTAFGLPPAADTAWTEATGAVSHGWLTRRAWLAGTRDDVDYTEQVLKVGWPFTTIRGFVRQRDGAAEHIGVALFSGNPHAEPARFIPLQIVWVGLVINTLLIAVLLEAIRRWVFGR